MSVKASLGTHDAAWGWGGKCQRELDAELKRKEAQGRAGKPGCYPVSNCHSLCCRYRTEDGSSARCRVDQPRTQIKRKGNSVDGLHNTQAQV
jgi:hypothetical protein